MTRPYTTGVSTVHLRGATFPDNPMLLGGLLLRSAQVALCEVAVGGQQGSDRLRCHA